MTCPKKLSGSPKMVHLALCLKPPAKKTLGFSFPLKLMLVWTFHMLGKGTKTGYKAFLVLAP